MHQKDLVVREEPVVVVISPGGKVPGPPSGDIVPDHSYVSFVHERSRLFGGLSLANLCAVRTARPKTSERVDETRFSFVLAPDDADVCVIRNIADGQSRAADLFFGDFAVGLNSP